MSTLTPLVISIEAIPDLPIDVFEGLLVACRPRILIVTDSSLSFNETSGFGLWRFLRGITVANGVTNKPVLTLAHRGFHVPTVIVGPDTYTVQTSFNFATAVPAVTLANYDQIWMFGFAATGSLAATETQVIADFMNGGGGVFATGDHADLGSQMCGNLPRIRRMREWASVPMGIEDDVGVAVQRIDTVVDPGTNGLYEFEDQSDDIPQRIFPNYQVTAATTSQWQATVHPLLVMPLVSTVRPEANGSAGFTQDIDVLPDHPHESICNEVTSPAVLDDIYLETTPDFEEFRPSVADAALRVGVEIVAYGISGGRSVFNSVWKPPVRPRMFGVISAYDGRLAQPYTGQTQRPGRIVCDSTWHHFLNVNLDGRSTSRSGLGTWSGGSPGIGTFTPGAALEKIFTYYRNIAKWLQPANRIWCFVWWDLVAVRFHPLMIEEVREVPRLKSWRDFLGLGREAAKLIAAAHGEGVVREMIDGVLLKDGGKATLADMLAGPELAASQIDADALRVGMLGAILAQLTRLLPENEPETVLKVLKAGPEPHVKILLAAANEALALALEDHAARAERTLALIRSRRLLER
jgi:hypothetical protein